jgi:enoyl-[acyl-carrier-protein] reductase (NADH)
MTEPERPLRRSAVLYLARASQVTGEVIHVDGGSHAGRW